MTEPDKTAFDSEKSKDAQTPLIKTETPKTAPEKTDKSLTEKGETVEATCKTPESKAIFNSEFTNSITSRISQFTDDFRKRFCDSNGQPELKKIMDIFGLGKFFDSTSTTTTKTSAQATPKPAGTDKPQIQPITTPEPIKTSPSSITQSPPTKPASTASKTIPSIFDVSFDSGKSKTTAQLDKSKQPSTIPERPTNAPSGKQFMAAMKSKFGTDYANPANQHKMEEFIMGEIARGNVPSFCRPENGKEITVYSYTTDKNGKKIIDKSKPSVTYKTSCDYVAIGSDKDYVRVPLTPLAIRSLEKYGWKIPTATMTDQTYANADKKLAGIGLVGTQADTQYMAGNGFIEKHNSKIEAQLTDAEKARLAKGQYLVAGHKKDIIISRYAIDHPRSLDFRGLYINGKPIQTNPAHEDTYRDYSHGFRSVYEKVVIRNPDGTTTTMNYNDALKDPKTATALNGAEGAIDASKGYDRDKIKENQLPGFYLPAQPKSSSPPSMVA